MLSRENIFDLLNILNDKLEEKDIKGEIALYGGTVMTIVLDARDCTKDIDAIFAPKKEFYDCIGEIANEYNLPKDWINDSIKGFIDSNKGLELYVELPNLTIYTAIPEYMFAMKAFSARTDTTNKDIEDLEFLIEYLEIKDIDSALDIVLEYFPSSMIQPKTQYLLDELINDVWSNEM